MSFDPVEIVLAGKPMAKERVQPNAHFNATHHYTPERTVAYEGRFALAAQLVMAGRPLLQGPLLLDIVVFVPIPESKPKKWKAAARAGEIRPTTKPDFQNYQKVIGALAMQVWVDDAQIVRGLLEKFYSDVPMMCMMIRPATDADRAIPAWTRKHQCVPIATGAGVLHEGGVFG